MSSIKTAPPEPVRLTFAFGVAQEWVDQHIVDHGTRPPNKFTFELELSELETPELRRRWLAAYRQYLKRPLSVAFAEPTDDLDEILGELERSLDAAAERPSPFGEEMQAWIAALGSDRLRTAYERGYKVNATYARERAAIEFSRYWIDTSGAATRRDRTDPSAEALALETEETDRLGDGEIVPRIVWLLEPPDDLKSALHRRGKRFKPCEAIFIEDYLGRYALFLPLPYPRGEE